MKRIRVYTESRVEWRKVERRIDVLYRLRAHTHHTRVSVVRMCVCLCVFRYKANGSVSSNLPTVSSMLAPNDRLGLFNSVKSRHEAILENLQSRRDGGIILEISFINLCPFFLLYFFPLYSISFSFFPPLFRALYFFTDFTLPIHLSSGVFHINVLDT